VPQPSKPKATKTEGESKAGVEEDPSAKELLRLDQEKRERRAAIVKETKKKLAAQKLARAEMKASLAEKQEKVDQLEAPIKAERAASAAAATKLQTRVRMQSAQQDVKRRREAKELSRRNQAVTKLQTRARMQFASKEVALKHESLDNGRAQRRIAEQTVRTENAGQFTRINVEEDVKLFGEALQNEIAHTSAEGRAVDAASDSEAFVGVEQRLKLVTAMPRSALKKEKKPDVVAESETTEALDVDATIPLSSVGEAQRQARAAELTPAIVEAELTKAKSSKEAMEEAFDENILNKANAAARAQKLDSKSSTAPCEAEDSNEESKGKSAALNEGADADAHDAAELGSDRRESKLTWAQASTLVVELGLGSQAHWAQVDAERFEARAVAKAAADAALQEAADALAAEEAKANAAEHQMEAIMAKIAALEAEAAAKAASAAAPPATADAAPVDATDAASAVPLADGAAAVGAADDSGAEAKCTPEVLENVSAEVKNRPSVARPAVSLRAKQQPDMVSVPVEEHTQATIPPPSLARPMVAKRVPGTAR